VSSTAGSGARVADGAAPAAHGATRKRTRPAARRQVLAPASRAVLTGEGVRRQRETVLVWCALLALLVAVGGGAWLLRAAFAPDGPQRALVAYDADFVAVDDYPQRHHALLARHWVQPAQRSSSGTAFLGSVEDAQIVRRRSGDPSAVMAEVVELLAGREYLDDLALWVVPEDRARVRALAAELVAQTDAGALRGAGVDAISDRRIAEVIREAGLGEDLTHALTLLLHREAAPGGGDWLDAVRTGEVDRVELAVFSDPDVSRLLVLDGGYRVATGSVGSGALLRFRDATDARWSDWGVLDSRDDNAWAQGVPENPLERSQRLAVARLSALRERRERMLAAGGGQAEPDDGDVVRANFE